MLQVDISIVPFGDYSEQREIFTLQIANVGVVREMPFGYTECAYEYRLIPKPHDRDQAMPDWTPLSEVHIRRDGALELVRKVLDDIQAEWSPGENYG